MCPSELHHVAIDPSSSCRRDELRLSLRSAVVLSLGGVLGSNKQQSNQEITSSLSRQNLLHSDSFRTLRNYSYVLYQERNGTTLLFTITIIMRLSFAPLLLLTNVFTALAFTPSTLQQQRTMMMTTTTTTTTTTSLASSTIEETTTTTTTATLPADYAAALTSAQTKLTASIPTPYHDKMLPLVNHFLTEYMAANAAAHQDKNHQVDDDETSADVAASRFVQGVLYALQYGMPQSPDHYTFDVTHTAQRGTDSDKTYGGVDFYAFGCSFFHGCMDLTSPETNVLGLEYLHQAVEQIERGENVVFFANHQSEADPQVASSCLALAGLPDLAADMVYVAGHKVTTDPLAIPFSMGRNLICIHSKKHIDADPDTKPTKQRQNLKAMNGLLTHLKTGGSCIWVAPSGGRDRRNPEDGTVPIAPFDSKTIDMFRLMGNKSKVPTHYYTMAMVSYDLCPPPDTVEAGVGEARNVRYVPVGIAISPELESVGGLEKRKQFCTNAMAQCQADYERLQASLEK